MTSPPDLPPPMNPRRRQEDPETAARAALADAERIAAECPEDGPLQLEFARCSLRLGEILLQRGADAGASRCFERARRITEREHQRVEARGEDSPDAPSRRLLAQTWLAVASSAQATGQHEEAAGAYRTALEWFGPLDSTTPASDRDLAERVGNAHGNLAVALDDGGDTEDAFGHYRLSLGIAEALHAAYDDRRTQAALALAHNGIAHHYGETDRLVDAEHHHEQSRALNQRLLDDRPDDDHLVYCLATDHENLCDLACRKQEFEAALEHGQRALQLRAGLCDRAGAEADPEWLELLADSHCDVAELMRDLERISDGIRHHRAAHRLAERLRATWPEVDDYRFRVADSLLMLGDALEENGQLEDALAAYRAALATDNELVEAAPDEVRWHTNAAQCELRAALVLLRLQRQSEAQRAIDSGLRILTAQIDRQPLGRRRGLMLDASRFHAEIANAWLQIAERESAEHHLRASLKLDRKLLQHEPDDQVTLAHLAITYDTLAALREEAGDFESARKFCGLAVRAEESLAARDPESVDYQVRLVQALLNLAGVLRSLDDDVESRATTDKAERVWARIRRLTPKHGEVRSLGGQLRRIRGIRLRDDGDADGARNALAQSRVIFELLRSEGQPIANLDSHYADTLEAILDLEAEEARPHEHVGLDDAFRTAVAARRALAEARGDDMLAWRDLARVLELAGEGLENAGRYDEAAPMRAEAAELRLQHGDDA